MGKNWFGPPGNARKRASTHAVARAHAPDRDGSRANRRRPASCARQGLLRRRDGRDVATVGTAMTKRRLLRWSLLLVILAAVAVWLEPTRVVWDWLRGEAFYQGRPTSWWRSELGRMSVRLIGPKMYEMHFHEHEFDSKFAANCEAATSVKFSRQISRF